MKNSKKSPQLPNNYRIITESSFYKTLRKLWFKLPNQSKLKKTLIFILIMLTTLYFIISFLGIGFLAVKFYENLSELNKITVQRESLRGQINFWQSVSEKYPEYKDAYFRIALLQYQLGDFQSAKKNNERALFLDPNFEDAKNLQAILDKNNY